jgi:two-component system, OmpR family, response regulator
MSVKCEYYIRGCRIDPELNLTPIEASLYALLMSKRGELVTRDEISQAVWSRQDDRLTNIIEVYVSYLRRKIAGSKDTIITVRHKGYVLQARQDRPAERIVNEYLGA